MFPSLFPVGEITLQGSLERIIWNDIHMNKMFKSQIHVTFFNTQMPKLQEKLHVELKDDAQVLACRFLLPNWMPVKVIEEGMDSVWLYWKTSDATKKEN